MYNRTAAAAPADLEAIRGLPDWELQASEVLASALNEDVDLVFSKIQAAIREGDFDRIRDTLSLANQGYWGSSVQITSSMVVAAERAAGGTPAAWYIEAILHPAGGIVGPSNSFAALRGAASWGFIKIHGVFHDAHGHLLTNYQLGNFGYTCCNHPGLPFLRSNPLAGQIGGITYQAVRTGAPALGATGSLFHDQDDP